MKEKRVGGYPGWAIGTDYPFIVDSDIFNIHFSVLEVQNGGYIDVGDGFGTITIDRFIIQGKPGVPFFRTSSKNGGNGASGSNGVKGIVGTAGMNALCHSWGISGPKASSGGTAGGGESGMLGMNGENGEDAKDITIRIGAMSNPNKYDLTFYSKPGNGGNGGNGGNAGSGGDGGKGGNGTKCVAEHSSSANGGNGGNGGDGASAGNGGNGGKGGKINLFIPKSDTSNLVGNFTIPTGGKGGTGGKPGVGGAGGADGQYTGEERRLSAAGAPGKSGTIIGGNGTAGQIGTPSQLIITKI